MGLAAPKATKRKPTIEIIPPKPDRPRPDRCFIIAAGAFVEPAAAGRLSRVLGNHGKVSAGAVCGIVLVVMLYLMKVILTG